MALSLFYVAGPVIILVELLKPALAIPALALVPLWIHALDSFLFSTTGRGQAAVLPDGRTGPAHAAWAAQAATVAVGALWIYYSGVGSFAFCRVDYIKHNILFSNLIGNTLPIKLESGTNAEFILHYYFSYYVIPVRISDGLRTIFDGVDLNYVVFAVYLLAFLASLRLIATCFRLSSLVALVLFAFTGGLDLAWISQTPRH
jgi:hypothetical protein